MGTIFNVVAASTQAASTAAGVAAVKLDQGQEGRRGMLVYNASAGDVFLSFVPKGSAAPLSSVVLTSCVFRIPTGVTLTINASDAVDVFMAAAAAGATVNYQEFV